MKAIAYKPDDLDELARLLDLIPVKGMKRIRIMSRIGDILNSGIPVEIDDNKENNENKK